MLVPLLGPRKLLLGALRGIIFDVAANHGTLAARGIHIQDVPELVRLSFPAGSKATCSRHLPWHKAI